MDQKRATIFWIRSLREPRGVAGSWLVTCPKSDHSAAPLHADCLSWESLASSKNSKRKTVRGWYFVVIATGIFTIPDEKLMVTP